MLIDLSAGVRSSLSLEYSKPFNSSDFESDGLKGGFGVNFTLDGGVGVDLFPNASIVTITIEGGGRLIDSTFLFDGYNGDDKEITSTLTLEPGFIFYSIQITHMDGRGDEVELFTFGDDYAPFTAQQITHEFSLPLDGIICP